MCEVWTGAKELGAAKVYIPYPPTQSHGDLAHHVPFWGVTDDGVKRTSYEGIAEICRTTWSVVQTRLTPPLLRNMPSASPQA